MKKCCNGKGVLKLLILGDAVLFLNQLLKVATQNHTNIDVSAIHFYKTDYSCFQKSDMKVLLFKITWKEGLQFHQYLKKKKKQNGKCRKNNKLATHKKVATPSYVLLTAVFIFEKLP